MKDIVTMYAGIRDSMSHIIARLVFRKSDYEWLKQNLHLFRVRKDTLLFCRFQELTYPVFTGATKCFCGLVFFFTIALVTVRYGIAQLASITFPVTNLDSLKIVYRNRATCLYP